MKKPKVSSPIPLCNQRQDLEMSLKKYACTEGTLWEIPALVIQAVSHVTLD